MEHRLIDANALKARIQAWEDRLNGFYGTNDDMVITLEKVQKQIIDDMPTVDAVQVPDGGIGELSDGYHTFNGLYYQRMMLFAALVKTYKGRAWKSRRHSDGEPCFGGGWFIVGIDTPQGGFTYHYEDKYFDLFDCVELPNGKEWDGHTEDDVTRLLTLDAGPVRCRECRYCYAEGFVNAQYVCECEKHYDFGNVDGNWFCADGERRDA